MGIASLVLGICGSLIAFTFFKDLSLIIGVVGLILGIIAIVKKHNRNLAIAGVVLSVIAIVLCFVTSFNFGNSANTGVTNDSGGNPKKVVVTADKVNVEEVGLTKAGDLVVKITNNNEGSVCLSYVYANFKDSAGNFAFKENLNNSFVCIPGNSSTMGYFWGYDRDYSQYPDVTFNCELANISDSFADSGVDVSSNNTGSQIAVTLKNSTGKPINHTSVVVIYYNGDEVVGAEYGSDNSTISAGGESFINVDYPTDKNYKDVEFDRFETYYVNASFA